MSDSVARKYDAYRRLFIFDDRMMSLKDFAVAYKINDVNAFVMHASQYDWEFTRQNFRDSVLSKVTFDMVDEESMSVVQKLREIQVLKSKAFEDAMQRVFKDSGQAVQAYIELEKLERTILGHSTDNIKFEDLGKYMAGVAMIIKSTIPEGPILDDIITRLSKFSFSDARKNGFDTPRAN